MPWTRYETPADACACSCNRHSVCGGEESIKFQPRYADRGDHIALRGSWTKGGRERRVPITTDEQRHVLDQAHQLAGAGSLIPAHKNYISSAMSTTANARRLV